MFKKPTNPKPPKDLTEPAEQQRLADIGVGAGEPPEPQPANQFLEKAASLWTYPQHAHKEMDSEFAMSIAFALGAAHAEGGMRFHNYRVENENLLRRIKDQLNWRDEELKVLRGKMEVFDTMRKLFESGNRGGLEVVGENFSWLIDNMLKHGTTYPAGDGMNSIGRSRTPEGRG